MFVVFFFFKQKTAYEVRISDWSSGVCSSDLSVVVLPGEVIQQTGSATLQDALRTVPGITFGAAEGGNPIGDRPFIRGFDSQGSVYVDGVRDFASQTREVFAVDSVQIVRGSDSTLGRSEGRRVGKLGVQTCRPRWAPEHKKK